MNPTSPPLRLLSNPLVPNIISLNLSVSETNPKAEPTIRFVVTPNGPPRNIAAAPRPILGNFSFKVFPILDKALSLPNNFSLRSSLLLAKPTADPIRIPAIGPPGTKGSIEAIPPTIAPLDILGKYL